jgi:hypothetical protein
MTDSVIELAKRSPISKSAGDWLTEINKRCSDPNFRKAEESSASAFSRFVTKTEDGKILHAAHNQQRLHELRNGRPAVAKSGGEEIMERLKRMVHPDKSGAGAMDDDAGDPASALAGMVDDMRAANPKLSRSACYDKVTQTPAGRKLLDADKAKRRAG